MKSLYACLAVCLGLLFAGCAVPQKPVYHAVTYDYDVNADFSRISSYKWVKQPATLRIDEFDQIRIKDAVNKLMAGKGMQHTVDKPDVYLIMYGGNYKAVDMAAMMDYKVYRVGRLKLAMYDARSNQEIWWAETRADLFHELTPAQKDAVVATAVQDILDFYPPQPQYIKPASPAGQVYSAPGR